MRLGVVAGGPVTAVPSLSPAVPVRGITIALVLAVTAYLAAAIAADWESVRRASATVPAWLLATVLAIACTTYLLRFLRWQGFLRSLGHEIPWHRHLEIYLAGLALTVSPGKVGELVRSVYLQAWGVGYARSIAAFVCERTWDVAMVAVLATLALIPFPSYWITAAIPIVLAATLVLSLHSPLAPALVSRVSRLRVASASAEGVDALRSLFTAGRLVPTFLWSLPVWALQGVALSLVVDALGHPLALPVAVGVYSLSILAGAMSFIPGGLGATEAAMVFLLKACGLGFAEAVYAALVARALPLWLAVGLGVVAMTRAARNTPQSV